MKIAQKADTQEEKKKQKKQKETNTNGQTEQTVAERSELDPKG